MVLTYNIHHGAGMDQKLDLQRLADLIKNTGADLVALQEVDLGTKRTGEVAQAQELGKLTGLHHAFGTAMEYDGGKYGDAVLSRFPVTSQRTIALPWEPGNKREPRCAIVITCDVPGRGKLTFASTHFDHTRDPSDRFIQAKGINAAFADDKKTPTILAGDFNCEPGSQPMEELATVWTLVSNGDPSPTCPADKPIGRIDHVFVKPRDRWKVIDAKVIDEAVISDHRPVLVKMELLP